MRFPFIKYLLGCLVLAYGCNSKKTLINEGTWKLGGAYIKIVNDTSYIELGADYDESYGLFYQKGDTIQFKNYRKDHKFLIEERHKHSIFLRNIQEDSIYKMEVVPNYHWINSDRHLSPPEQNFEKLWQDFEKDYAFFALRDVDWKELYEIYRPKISSTTHDSTLYRYMTEMLSLFDDGHVRLDRLKEDERPFVSAKQPSNRYYRIFNADERKEINEITKQTLFDNGCTGYKTIGRGAISYCQSDEFGYLKITRFGGYGDINLEAALDSIMNTMQDKPMMLIDVRVNFGGQDYIAYQFADRFADKKRVGHLERQRNGPDYEDFTEYEITYLNPEEKKGFRDKPVYIITNSAVFSAGEIFVLSLKGIPNVTVVGNNTKGMLSSMLERHLFNGWDYTLSNQRIYTRDTICYEKYGVPPDVTFLQTKEHIKLRTDSIILKTLNLNKIPLSKLNN